MPAETEQLNTLAAPAREWAQAVLSTHDLTDTGRILVIEAARCIDQIEQCRAERSAIVVEGRYANSARTAPLFVAERQSRQDLLAVLKQLQLDGPE